MTPRPEPMVIGGMPRSGTTLLAALCRGHPEISITVELRNYELLDTTFAEYARASAQRLRYVRGSWRFYGRRYGSSLLNFSTNVLFLLGHLVRVRRHIDGTVTTTTLATTTAFGAKIAADKFPDYVFSMDEFARDPDLRCVVIYRDCRDVASSFLSKVRTTWKHHPWADGIDAAEISRRWVRSIDIVEALSGRVFAIRYEALVQDPRPELERFAQWLDVDPDGFTVGSVRETSIGKYSSGLTDEELSTVNRIAGPTMERLGYR